MTGEDGRDGRPAGEPDGDRPVEASASGASGAATGSRDEQPPERVGHYRIEDELGRGGMGIVYRAVDERLGRTVALKALPASVGLDGPTWARLEREAKLLALVAHPNVAAIHALETRDGRPFLVLEHVEGVSLAHLLRDGAVPVQRALDIVAKVASALEAAHGRGVIHRDLKPANVMVTPDGSVKVLDFGLSKAMQAVEELRADVPPADDPDLSSSGSVLGTLSYLSPEQLRGESADERVDLWAIGCILFEALTGTRIWGTGPAAERVRAILDAEPDWTALPLDLPSGLSQLLEHCLEPDRSLRLADAGVLRERLEAALSGPEAGASTGRRSPPSNLPRQLPSFVGRRAEIEKLGAWLAEPGLVTVVGLGGCGKTRLALEAARGLDAGLDAIGFVDVAPLAEGGALAPALATALSLQVPKGGSALDVLRETLAEWRALVVLDSCEHLLAECAELAHALLDAAPELHVLATSRERLETPGERLLRLEPLALPDDDGASTEAVELFLERAREAVPELALTPEDRATANRICRRLDGLPLALELAAARLRALSLDQLDARLDDRFRLLRDRRRATPRHATLRALIDWSHEQLDDDERRLLRRVAIFQGGFTLAAAERACAFGGLDEQDVLDLLSGLIDRSLVSTDRRGVEMRYRLLDTVREYAHECLRQAGEEDVAASAHLDWALELAESTRDLYGPEALRVLDRLNEAHADLLAALGRAGDRAELLERGGRLAGLLPRFWTLRGHLEAAHPVVSRLVDAGRRVPATPGHGWALWTLGELDYYRTALEAAGCSYREAHDLADELGIEEVRAAAMNGLGLVANAQGRPEDARPFFVERRRILQERGADQLIPLVDNNLAITEHFAGRREEAERLYRRVLADARRFGNRELLATAHQNLGVIAFEDGRHADAIEAVSASRRLREQLGDGRGVVHARVNLGTVHWSLGDAEAARREWEEALEQARRVGAREAMLSIHNNLAWLAQQRGDVPAARRHAAEGLSRCAGESRVALNIAENVARMELHDGRFRAAAVMLGAADAHRERTGHARRGDDAAEHERDLQRLREKMDERELERARSEGRALPLDELVRLARESCAP